MENIRQAVERARAGQSSFGSEILQSSGAPLPQHLGPPTVSRAGAELQTEEIRLDSTHLASKRIVSHNGADHRSRPYDVLRTQVLQSMTAKKWKILGVTSPTPGCGKTLTAVNLAFSIARQPDKSVVLVDMDLQKPQLANCLGVTFAAGVFGFASRARRIARSGDTRTCRKSANCSLTYRSHETIVRVDRLSRDVKVASGS